MAEELRISLVNEGTQGAVGPDAGAPADDLQRPDRSPLSQVERALMEEIRQLSQPTIEQSAQYIQFVNRDAANPSAVQQTSTDVQREAAERLQNIEHDKEVRLEMRAQDERYDVQQTEIDVRRALAAEISKLIDERRRERLQIAEMTDDERLNHAMEREVKRQRDREVVTETAYDVRMRDEPDFRAQEEEKDKKRAELQERRERADEMRAERQAEQDRRAALTEDQRAEEDAADAVADRLRNHAARMKVDDEYRERIAKQRGREAEQEALKTAEGQAHAATERDEMHRDVERMRRDPLSPSYDAEYDLERTSREIAEETRNADAADRQRKQQEHAAEKTRRDGLGEEGRLREDMEKSRQKDELRDRIDREMNPDKYARQEKAEADKKRYEPYGPFAGTAKRYAEMFDTLWDGAFGSSKGEEQKSVPTARPAQDTAQQGPHRQAEAAAPAGSATEGVKGAGAAAEALGAGSALAEAGPIIGAVAELVNVAAGAAGAVEKLAGSAVRGQEILFQGGAHQASASMENVAQVQSSSVDWIPVVGPALGKLMSFGTEMAATAMRAVENVAVQAADTMRGAAQIAASILTFDAKALGAQMGELAEKRIPILGTVVHGVTDTLLTLDRGVSAAAERLADFHGGLAQQRAFEDMTKILREMDRAQRFGDTTQRAEQARFGAEMRIQQLADRFVPFIMAASEQLFLWLGNAAEWADEQVKAILESIDSIVLFVKQLALTPAPIREQLGKVHDLIRSALDDNANGENFLDQEWQRMRGTNRSAPAVSYFQGGPRSLPMPGV